VPGSWGEVGAFVAEVAIAFVLMTTVLAANASSRLMRWTGVCAGALVALYIMVEAPVSGMSLNPARSVASAVPSGIWHGIWIYLTAPLVGMLLAAELHLRRGRRTLCAKLHHNADGRCIFRCDFAAAVVFRRARSEPNRDCPKLSSQTQDAGHVMGCSPTVARYKVKAHLNKPRRIASCEFACQAHHLS
jgi:hypothetical protein